MKAHHSRDLKREVRLDGGARQPSRRSGGRLSSKVPMRQRVSGRYSAGRIVRHHACQQVQCVFACLYRQPETRPRVTTSAAFWVPQVQCMCLNQPPTAASHPSFNAFRHTPPPSPLLVQHHTPLDPTRKLFDVSFTYVCSPFHVLRTDLLFSSSFVNKRYVCSAFHASITDLFIHCLMYHLNAAVHRSTNHLKDICSRFDVRLKDGVSQPSEKQRAQVRDLTKGVPKGRSGRGLEIHKVWEVSHAGPLGVRRRPQRFKDEAQLLYVAVSWQPRLPQQQLCAWATLVQSSTPGIANTG
jgi:hypothetical protein